jgi:hypothetical protein
MSEPIARSKAEAIDLGFKPSTRTMAEIYSIVQEQIANGAQGAFQRDCLTPNMVGPCLQTDVGPDGKRTICFCVGASCTDCHDG